MCNYQGYEFGAGRYPDSVCIDGRLFDADNCDSKGNLYEPMEEIPCPMCNEAGAISDYQRLRKAGLCTRDCGRKGELKNPKSPASKNNTRRSECRTCRDGSHGK